MLIAYFILGTILSILLALLEIQIEGKNGWAEKLPTWRVKNKWSEYIIGGSQELTGYHTYLWLFIYTFSHTPLIFIPWTIGTEILILSFCLFVIGTEDVLWFLLNPAYGWNKFNKQNIKWHRKWLGPFPLQYYSGFLLWWVLFYIGISK